MNRRFVIWRPTTHRLVAVVLLLAAAVASARAADLLRDTPVARELRDLRLRGGVVAASGAATALLAKTFAGDGGATAAGLDLLPGTMFNAVGDALPAALDKSPGLLG